MANSYFHFKKFTIRQDKCAMKVGTDGVLLGAWADVTRARTILDIGTGTGLIALMLAQKSNARIDAIEIDEIAANQAIENFLNSSWKNRICIYPVSLQKFIEEQDIKYDLIVSNPPYFTNSFSNPDAGRKLARHDDKLGLDELFSCISLLINRDGIFAIIYPSESAVRLYKTASDCNMHLIRLTEVFPTPQKKSNRILAEFSFQECVTRRNKLIIEEASRHKYSAAYIELTKDFYLNF